MVWLNTFWSSKYLRIMLIFNLNVVFLLDFVKMISVWVRCSPGFLRGEGFSGEQSHHNWPVTKWGKMVFRGANCASMVLELRWNSLTLSQRKWCSGEELLQSSRTTLEQFALRKTWLLREIQGWSAHGGTPFLKKFNVETHFKLNINVIRNLFNYHLLRLSL
jgi:hypothetical protein